MAVSPISEEELKKRQDQSEVLEKQRIQSMFNSAVEKNEEEIDKKLTEWLGKGFNAPHEIEIESHTYTGDIDKWKYRIYEALKANYSDAGWVVKGGSWRIILHTPESFAIKERLEAEENRKKEIADSIATEKRVKKMIKKEIEESVVVRFILSFIAASAAVPIYYWVFTDHPLNTKYPDGPFFLPMFVLTFVFHFISKYLYKNHLIERYK